MRVIKTEQKKQIVWGEVYAPGVPDTDGEFMSAETIEKMAYEFMRNQRLTKVDKHHNNEIVEDTCVVESFVARKGDPDFIEGAWVVGVHVPDKDTWAEVEKQELNGFSLEAMVKKRKTTLTMEIPSVLSGKTDNADNHTHEFFVTYDDDGNFLGGKTSVSMGHSHSIKRGTVTEEYDGHAHRFSYVELMNE
jgi:hypothetical protein